MTWKPPKRRLGEEQRSILDHCLRKKTGVDWIQGFAGSGKTVILAYLIEDLLAADPDLDLCVVVYTNAMVNLIEAGIPQPLKVGGKVPVMTYHKFRRGTRHYDIILVDEVQDLKKEVLERLKDSADRLIVAGDSDQSIYDSGVSAEQMEAILSPDVHKLKVVYRLSEDLRDIARAILPESSIEAASIDRMQQTVKVSLAKAEDPRQEVDWVWWMSRRYAQVGEPSGVLFARHEAIRGFVRGVCTREGVECPPFNRIQRGPNGVWDYEPVNEAMRAREIPLRYLGGGYGDLEESEHVPIVYLMTYHSAKGLDFETVFLPSLNQNTFIPRPQNGTDRPVLFVAVSRSRRDLFISYSSSEPHPYIAAIPRGKFHEIRCALPSAGDENDPLTL